MIIIALFISARGEKLSLITVQLGAGWLEQGVMNGVSLASNFLVQSQPLSTQHGVI